MSGARAGIGNLTSKELDRAKHLQAQGKSAAEVSYMMGRDKSCICRHFNRSQEAGSAPPAAHGRPPMPSAVLAPFTDTIVRRLDDEKKEKKDHYVPHSEQL